MGCVLNLIAKIDIITTSNINKTQVVFKEIFLKYNMKLTLQIFKTKDIIRETTSTKSDHIDARKRHLLHNLAYLIVQVFW